MFLQNFRPSPFLRRPTSVESYFSRVALGYAERSESGAWGAIRKFELRAVGKALSLNGSERVFEIGCGAGFYPKALSKYAKQWLSIEPNRAMFEKCDQVGYKTLNCTLQDFRASNPAEKFDRVLIAGVLEFCETVAEAREMCAWAIESTSTNGHVVLLTPSLDRRGEAYLKFHRSLNCPTLSISDIRAATSGFGDARKFAGPFSDVIVKKAGQ